MGNIPQVPTSVSGVEDGSSLPYIPIDLENCINPQSSSPRGALNDSLFYRSASYNADTFSAWGPFCPLPFIQRLETGTFNVAEVNENIRTAILPDKTEALISIEPFNRTGSCRSHNINPKNLLINPKIPN